MRVYYDSDADINLIKGKKVAIIGYGSQGHAHALNLRDSGVKEVCVALRAGFRFGQEGGRRWARREERRRCRQMGRCRDDAGARTNCSATFIAIISVHNLKQGAALMFAHGLNIHFNLIEPRGDLDVLMVAPKGPGHTVRSEYKRGGGVPCLVAVARNPSGNAHDLALSYGAAIGGGRAGLDRDDVPGRMRDRSCSASRWCSAAVSSS